MGAEEFVETHVGGGIDVHVAEGENGSARGRKENTRPQLMSIVRVEVTTPTPDR